MSRLAHHINHAYLPDLLSLSQLGSQELINPNGHHTTIVTVNDLARCFQRKKKCVKRDRQGLWNGDESLPLLVNALPLVLNNTGAKRECDDGQIACAWDGGIAGRVCQTIEWR